MTRRDTHTDTSNTTVEGPDPGRVDTVVIGGGQSGLSVGYHLARHDLNFVILDASERIGDAWRNRWDSLRLFTPNRFNQLVGLPFPGDPNEFCTKDEMADYLEVYAEHFALPVRSNTRVERLWQRDDGAFSVASNGHRWDADNVVVALGTYQQPSLPRFAADLRDDIVQFHSHYYRNPGQLQDGPVLVVGAANSGAEIARDLADHHEVLLAGDSPGEIPFDIERRVLQPLVTLVGRGLFHRVLNVDTPMGRRARPHMLHAAAPLVRTKAKHLAAAGVERLPRVQGIRKGLPVLANGRQIDVANVVWATGFRPGLDWVDLPAFDDDGEPGHDKGISHDVPGLYFVGLNWLWSHSSGMIHGMQRDARHVVDHLAGRVDASAATGRRRTVPA